MTAAQAHERITVLEGRVGEIETGFGETIYKVHRRLAKLEIGLTRGLTTGLTLPAVSEEEIDELLDRE